MSECPSTERLRQFAEEQLKAADRLAVAEHARSCAHCQQALLTLKETKTSSDAELSLNLAAEKLLLERLKRMPPPTAKLPWPDVPGYEILGELGVGGMGVVYKARQIGAGRLVAIKMILGLGVPSVQAKVRFQIEAEAVAALVHPNIVQLHQVGQVVGHPFFSLEYCEGGSLNSWLQHRRAAGQPLAPRATADLIEKLARAMHFAHLRGVVHRDLKPSNVLLTAGGEPKISDFGLAKRLDHASDVSRPGAVIGAPSYMAPELARGESKQAGPATDVYGLGAILYECLTGRPPFQGETVADTIRQVVEAPPVSPRRLQASTPRDLETICLACLHKDPKRRYSGADALAEDLRRFQAHEPISRRPVGALERVALWARRQPAVAALIGLFVVSLLAGAGLSTYLAIVANRRAEQAEGNDRATRAALKRVAEEQKRTADFLVQAREARAIGLLRPIGHDARPIGNYEWTALSELAGLPDEEDEVRIRLVERALTIKQTAEQLVRRGEHTLHAVVGLNRERNKRTLDLLLRTLRDEKMAPPIREACAVTIAHCFPPGNADAAMGPVLVKGIVDYSSRESNILANQYSALLTAASQMRSDDAGAAARLILDEMPRADDYRYRVLAGSLAAIAPRLDSRNADEAAGRLIDMIAAGVPRQKFHELKVALQAIESHLPVQKVDRVVLDLVTKIEETTDQQQVSDLSDQVGLLAPALTMGQRQAATRRTAGRLVKCLEGQEYPNTWHLIASSNRVIKAMDNDKAAEFALNVIAALARPGIHSASDQELRALAERLRADRADRATDVLLRALETAEGLQEITVRLGQLKIVAEYSQKQAFQDSVGRRSKRILQVLEKNPDPFRLFELICELFSLPRSSEERARDANQLALSILGQMLDPAKLQHAYSFGIALVPLAPWLPEKNARDIARQILHEMPRRLDRNSVVFFAPFLGAVSSCLDIELAEESARQLITAMPGAMPVMPSAPVPVPDGLKWESYYLGVEALATALAAVAPKMREENAYACADEAARRILDAMVNRTHSTFRNIAPALRPLAPWLRPSTANEAATKIRAAMSREREMLALFDLARALGSLTSRHDQAGAEDIARTVVNAMATPDSESVGLVVLTELTPHMRPDVAAHLLLVGTTLHGYKPPDKLNPKPLDHVAGEFATVLLRLSRQQLVDVLKHPGCVGWAREEVLRQFERQANRRFTNVWELVDWLIENDPGLDILSPPADLGRN